MRKRDIEPKPTKASSKHLVSLDDAHPVPLFFREAYQVASHESTRTVVCFVSKADFGSLGMLRRDPNDRFGKAALRRDATW